jgi:RNA polymerase primary sigma factor
MVSTEGRSGPGDTGSLFQYLKEIGRHAKLTTQDEQKLAVRIRSGDRAALTHLVQANLRFVVSVAKNYRNQGLPLADLINEGNLGLIRAARRFDEKKNFKFISYAVWWIRQSILQFLAEQSRVVKIPLSRVGMLYRIGKAQVRLEQKHNRLPNPGEVAQELGLKEHEVRETLQIGNNAVSLDSPLQGDEAGCLLDVLCAENAEAPDDQVIDTSLQKEVNDVLEDLSEREREVIKLYFGIGEEVPQTLEEIGRRFKLTRERTRQIKERAISRLKHCSARGHLMSYYL